MVSHINRYFQCYIKLSFLFCWNSLLVYFSPSVWTDDCIQMSDKWWLSHPTPSLGKDTFLLVVIFSCCFSEFMVIYQNSLACIYLLTVVGPICFHTLSKELSYLSYYGKNVRSSTLDHRWDWFIILHMLHISRYSHYIQYPLGSFDHNLITITCSASLPSSLHKTHHHQWHY